MWSDEKQSSGGEIGENKGRPGFFVVIFHWLAVLHQLSINKQEQEESIAEKGHRELWWLNG